MQRFLNQDTPKNETQAPGGCRWRTEFYFNLSNHIRRKVSATSSASPSLPPFT